MNYLPAMEDANMANPLNPNDPYQGVPYNPMPADDMRRPPVLDSDLQIDPELAEGRAGGGRVAIYALGAAIVLGAVFYGLNNTSINPGTGTATTQTAPATRDTAQSKPGPTNNIADSGSSKPAVPPGIRDVTPNNQSGVTTGAAPTRQQSPASAPTGTEVDRSDTNSTR
jgi:hypothetical protein